MRKAILILVVLGACGGGDDGWSDSQRRDFIAGCTSSGPSEEICTCIADKLEEAHPDLTDPADLDTDEVTEFTKECV